MTRAQELLGLAEACEQATGPDLDIDGAIDRLMNERPKHGDYHDGEACIWRVEKASGLCVRGDGFARESFCARRYTESLDAAMTLVPASYRLGALGESPFEPEGLCTAHLFERKHAFGRAKIHEGSAATPALALTAAALRALAQTRGDDRG